MIKRCICKQCGIGFMGGPRAMYCPSCRISRRQESGADYKRRARRGAVRKLGSNDTCIACSKVYTVNGANQMYCPKCAPLKIAEIKREMSLDWYHQNKEEINPTRNQKRHIGLISCRLCGKVFDPCGTVQKYCSAECLKTARNERWRERYHKNKK